MKSHLRLLRVLSPVVLSMVVAGCGDDGESTTVADAGPDGSVDASASTDTDDTNETSNEADASNDTTIDVTGTDTNGADASDGDTSATLADASSDASPDEDGGTGDASDGSEDTSTESEDTTNDATSTSDESSDTTDDIDVDGGAGDAADAGATDGDASDVTVTSDDDAGADASDVTATSDITESDAGTTDGETSDTTVDATDVTIVDEDAGDADVDASEGTDTTADAATTDTTDTTETTVADSGVEPFYWSQDVWAGEITPLTATGELTQEAGEVCVSGEGTGVVGLSYNVNQANGGEPEGFAPDGDDDLGVAIFVTSLSGAEEGEVRFTADGVTYCAGLEVGENFHPWGSFTPCGLGGQYDAETEFSTIRLRIEVDGAFELCVDDLDVGEGVVPDASAG